MIGLLILALALAFLGSIAGTLWALDRGRDGWAAAGVCAMILIGLQLGGACELALP